MTGRSGQMQTFWGWLGAASAAAVLLSGAAVLALTAQPGPQPLMLDLGRLPPAAPAIAAVAAAAPEVIDEAPDLAKPLSSASPDTPPSTPKTEAKITPPPVVTPPEPAVPTRTEIAPPKPDTPPVAKNKPKAKPPVKAKTPKPKPADKPAAAAASAPKAGAKAKGGAKPMTAAAYAKAVMKKVRSTKKRTGMGKGVAVVGFTIAGNGSLAGVQIVQSSGTPALDKIALNHIQRSAPFAPPPAGAGRSFAFEFEGK